jgi:hypothetical protein
MSTTGTTANQIFPQPPVAVVCPTCHHCPTCGRDLPQPFVQWQPPYQQAPAAPWYATSSGPALTPIHNSGTTVRAAAD